MIDPRGGFAALLLAVVLSSAACGPTGPPAQNVLLVLVDTLRSDRLSCYGYDRPTTPNLDRLASGGAVFLTHYAQNSHTRASLPSLTYSRYFAPPLFPGSAQVALKSPQEVFQRLDQGAIALPRVLAAAGRWTVLINTHPWLREETEFARLHDEVIRIRQGRDEETGRRGGAIAPADDMVDAAIRWLEANAESPFYMHLHLMDPHEPLFYTEDAERMLGEEASDDPARWEFGEWTFDRSERNPETVAWLNAAYDGTVHFLDRELGRLFDYLRSVGLLDTTLIVVTSDHGEMLFERGQRRGHGGMMYEGVARVPLILHYPPRIAPRRFEGLSESVDVMPTILAVTGDDPGEGRWMDGIDLLSDGGDGKTHVLSPIFIRGRRYKLLLRDPLTRFLENGRLDSPRAELYDLEADPEESRNLWSTHGEIVNELLTVYRRRLSTPLRRFEQARADEPPDSGFAVAAEHFVVRPVGAEPADWTMVRSGWRRDSSRNTHWLAASPGAEPIEVAFEIPSGRYRVSVGGRGRFTVTAGVDPDCGTGEPAAIEFDRDRSRWHRQIIGPVSVCEARFQARVEPQDAAAVYYLGFQPLRGDELAAPEDPELDRELEALGYIN